MQFDHARSTLWTLQRAPFQLTRKTHTLALSCLETDDLMWMTDDRTMMIQKGSFRVE